MFSDLVDRKLAILDYKNVDFKKSNILHFFKGVSPWFAVKIWKLSPRLFFSETDSKLAILD